jgi:AcrR family transcriptional regulator
VPAEERLAERRRLLLDTAFDLLGTDGWTATTVRGVCNAARLNPRYFYESFADLDELLIAVYDRIVEDAYQTAAAAVAAADDDAASKARAGIGALMRFVVEDARRARILFVEAAGNERLMRRRLDVVYAAAAVVEAGGAKLYGSAPMGEHLGRITSHLLVGGATELLITWLDGKLDVTLDDLVDDATALFIATGESAQAIAAARSRARA